MEKSIGRNKKLIQYLKYFVSIIGGTILGIYFHLYAFITFIPKNLHYWYLYNLLFWIIIWNSFMHYILFYNKEEYIKEKKLRTAESGVIDDEMILEIKTGINNKHGKGILSFDPAFRTLPIYHD